MLGTHLKPREQEAQRAVEHRERPKAFERELCKDCRRVPRPGSVERRRACLHTKVPPPTEKG